MGYQQLMDKYSLTQDEVSRAVGKSRPAVANALRLLNLPEEVLSLVGNGRISAGHARTLLSFKDPDELDKAARLVSTQDISVRELERLAKRANKAVQEKTQELKEKKLSYYEEVELALREHLGRRVKVSGTNEKGTLEIEFYGRDDLHDLALLLEKE